MSDEFTETGQTFTDDGAAYCPVERKDRGAVGIAASLAVLAGGAAFLTYAMLGATPRPEVDDADPAQIAQSISPPAPEFATEVATEFARGAVPPASVDHPPAAAPEPETGDLVADALAQSRAARAGVDAPLRSFGAPSLKSSAAVSNAAYATAGDEFKPRVKPVITRHTKVAAPSVRLTPIGAVAKPSAPSPATPIIFLPANGAELRLVPAVAYARDIARNTVNTTITIARGETFVDALKRAGVGAGDRNAAAYAFGEHYNLRRLKPGQQFKLRLGWANQTLFQLAQHGEPETRLLSLSFRDGFEQEINVTRDGAKDFVADATPIELTTHIHAVEGRIDGSLYLSAKSLGAPDDVIAGLADAFAYDVDFQREIFGGDEFELIFEAKYDDRGLMAAGGEIIFARLNWRGKSREKGYYRFTEDDGRSDFYDAAGQSAKRLLMKTPIDGARLSSRFGTRRHPILGYRRAHKGVDFAAPRGTPIKAAGDGVIERADRYGSFGNYIRIRHANGYKTAYAHLKGFRKGIRKGKRVRQGDTIGYVGTTGRSTGPHLHYEVHLRGKAVNPQKLKIATGKQLTGVTLDRFKIQRDQIDLMRTPPADDATLFAEGRTAAKESL